MDIEIPSETLSRTWASREFATLNCGDVRCQRRFVRVASDFIQHPGSSISQASGDWAGTKAFIALDLVVASHLLALAWQVRVSPEACSGEWLARHDPTQAAH